MYKTWIRSSKASDETDFEGTPRDLVVELQWRVSGSHVQVPACTEQSDLHSVEYKGWHRLQNQSGNLAVGLTRLNGSCPGWGSVGIYRIEKTKDSLVNNFNAAQYHGIWYMIIWKIACVSLKSSALAKHFKSRNALPRPCIALLPNESKLLQLLDDDKYSNT